MIEYGWHQHMLLTGRQEGRFTTSGKSSKSGVECQCVNRVSHVPTALLLSVATEGELLAVSFRPLKVLHSHTAFDRADGKCLQRLI